MLCPNCGQANRPNEDTPAYYQAYNADTYEADHYASPDRESFCRRVADVYRPKADFLWDVLAQEGVDGSALRHAEIGAGSGYFIAALLDAGARQAVGYEVSPDQVAFAQKMLGEGRVVLSPTVGVGALLRGVDSEVISMIFSLEHVEDPRDVLEALTRNSAARYFYFAVPMLSASALMDSVFPDVYHRVTDGHHHLFTDQSIEWICRHFGWQRIGEWWFGGDALDLVRSIGLQLQENGSRRTSERWVDAMVPMVDALQLEMDRRHLSSEVHVVLKKCR